MTAAPALRGTRAGRAAVVGFSAFLLRASGRDWTQLHGGGGRLLAARIRRFNARTPGAPADEVSAASRSSWSPVTDLPVNKDDSVEAHFIDMFAEMIQDALRATTENGE
jgi:hypothetical protein